MAVNKDARQIVQRALEKGYDYETIAELCGVSIGSIRRWVATGRAKSSVIVELEKEIGKSYLSAETVSSILIDIYRKRGKNRKGFRYRIKRMQLKRIAGRRSLGWKFIEELSNYLSAQGYIMIEESDGIDDFFIVIRQKQLLIHVKRYISDTEINNFFRDLSDDIEGDDDDE
jgi:transposase